jgi:CBS domain-containing protein
VTGGRRLARRTTVAASQDLLEIEPLLVPADEDLLAAMRLAARHPSTRVIGVLDAGGRLTGVVPVSVLAEAVVAHAVPEAFFADLGDLGDIGRFAHAIEARTIGEIADPPVSVTPERTIGDAFRLMHQGRLSGLYVVDADGRPVGYLDLQELAMRYVEALEEERGAAAATVDEVQDPPTGRT